jgi:hypothetical protein
MSIHRATVAATQKENHNRAGPVRKKPLNLKIRNEETIQEIHGAPRLQMVKQTDILVINTSTVYRSTKSNACMAGGRKSIDLQETEIIERETLF